MRIMILRICFLLLLLKSNAIIAQSIAPGTFLLDDYVRRTQLLNLDDSHFDNSFRPLIGDFRTLLYKQDSFIGEGRFGIMPIFLTNRIDTKRPYYNSPFSLIPSKGFQTYFSGGFFYDTKYINIQFQPEFVWAQNSNFQGFTDQFSTFVTQSRFHFWNYGDYPELFGSSSYYRFFLGQSSLTFKYSGLEVGISNKNIWWGPGQWNALTFSNNAPGFAHLTFNTYKPLKTFLGNFNFQLLVGRLEDSGFDPTQFPGLNNRYFLRFQDDWRYLNALMISYQPQWLPNFNFGVTRTFQRYSRNEGRSFRDILPVFEGFQKIGFFTNGNAVEYDADGYDQNVTFFTRYINKKIKSEFYFEYGRRDHSLNWREMILNPEHARAFLLGFLKLVPLPENKFVQIRSEITHQQESVNRYIRYPGLLGGNSWHTHYQARGFSNFGQPLGVGIGTGSNIQTLEVSLTERLDKIGILFERLENHQDFFYRAFGQQNEHEPWIDLSVGFLFDKQWDNILLNSKFQFINGKNYQWQLSPNSSPEFPQGQDLFSIHSQVSLIYLFKN
jgi:hypothetical protein